MTQKDITLNDKESLETNKVSKILSDVIDFLPDPAFVIDKEGIVVIWNKAMEEMSGVEATDIIGKGNYEYSMVLYKKRHPVLIDLVLDREDEDAIKNINNNYTFIKKEGDTFIAENLITNAKGKKLIVSRKATPLYDSQKKVAGAIETIRDITELKHIEEALRDSEQRMGDIINFLPDPTLVIDTKGKVIAWNHAIEEMTGIKAKDMLGKGDYEYAIPFYGIRRPLLVDLAFKSDKEIEEDYTYIQKYHNTLIVENIITHPNHKIVVLWAKATLLYDSAGEMVGAIESIRDVTERWKMEQELKRDQKLFIGGPVVVFKIENKENYPVKYVSPNIEQYGYNQEDLINGSITFTSLIHPDDYKRVISEIKEYENSKEDHFEQDFRIIRSDGEIRWVYCFTVFFRDSDGYVQNYDNYILNITERKLAERETVAAREAALEALKSKSDFLAAMSHEIRTPMNAIIGMGDLLWETQLSEDQKEYTRVIRRAGNNLLNLINDILDVSKMEAGYLALEEIEFDLRTLIERTLSLFAVRAHDKDIELTYYIDADNTEHYIGDSERLRQILVNLIDNAIKFTEKGEIVLKVESDTSSKDNQYITFSVSDTGIGIPLIKQDNIFSSYKQADASVTRKYGGTGLGLTICRQLVELQGGKIWFESEENKGSTFYFKIPFKVKDKEPGIEEKLPIQLKGTKILIVDDNSTNREILKEILTKMGASVTEAENGQGALEKLRETINAKPFDLVILDSHMPGMSGFDVIEAIDKEIDIKKITLMMLTNSDRSMNVAKVKKLGIEAYLIKPIRRAYLMNAICSILFKNEENEEKTVIRKDTETIPLVEKLDILLAEDCEDNCLLIQHYLKNTNYNLDIAENGQIAVEKYIKGNYGIVLMDIQLPVIDGYTATGEIRKWERENNRKNVPIIALTAYAFADDIKKSIEAGCNSHITKPIKKDVLLKIIYDYTKGAKGIAEE